MEKKDTIKIVILVVLTILIFCTAVVLTAIDNKNKDSDTSTSVSYSGIIEEDITSVKLEYYPGNNIATGEYLANSNLVSLVSIDITKRIDKNYLLSLTKSKHDLLEDDTNRLYTVDDFRLIINDKYSLSFGEYYGEYVKDENNTIIFDVSEDLYNKIEDIIKEYNEDNVYLKLSSPTSISISYLGGKNIDIYDKYYIQQITELNYYPIKDYKESGNLDILYSIVFDTDTRLTIYKDNVVMKYVHGDTAYYIYSVGYNLNDIVDTLYSNLNSGLASYFTNLNSITVYYNGTTKEYKTYSEISSILKKLGVTKFSHYKYLDSMDINNIEKPYIKVILGKYTLYISTDSSIGNRYLVDQNGYMYDADISSSGVETAIKVLIDYK